MNWVDYCILAMLVISLLVGLLRGFTREALNLTSWVIAFLASLLLAPPVERLLRGLIGLDTVRVIVAYVAVFIIALMIGAIITHIVSNAIRRTPFSGPDRMLGAGFGLGRGAVLIIAAVMVGGLTVVTEEPWWQESLLIERAEPAAQWARSQLPEAWLEDIVPAAQASTEAEPASATE
jgi:membrane protein required for colicin V production